MKLRMLTGLAGMGFSLAPREITDRFNGLEAENLIAAGYAEILVEEDPAVSTESLLSGMTVLNEQIDAGIARERLLVEDALAAAEMIVDLTEKVSEGLAREGLLAESVAAAEGRIAELTQSLAQSQASEAELNEKLALALKSSSRSSVDAKGKSATTKETAEKPPAEEKRD